MGGGADSAGSGRVLSPGAGESPESAGPVGSEPAVGGVSEPVSEVGAGASVVGSAGPVGSGVFPPSSVVASAVGEGAVSEEPSPLPAPLA